MKNKKLTAEEKFLMDEMVIDEFLKYFEPKYNWQYFVEYNYDRNSYGCNSGCDEWACRCKVISNVKIEYVRFDSLLRDLREHSTSEILNYCVDRILRSLKFFEPDNFEPDICKGYYGEEVDGIYLNQIVAKNIHDNIFSLKKLSDLERIKAVLKLEYGYLLDVIKDAKNFEVREFDLDKIARNDEYRKKIDTLEDYYNDEYTLPRGIFVVRQDGRYRLIDGYHRVSKAEAMNMGKVKGIVLL